MSKTITVLSRPGCVQCNATYRLLDKKKVAYTIGDALSEEGREITAEHGIQSAPVVVVRKDGKIEEVWGGFRPDRIGAYAADPAATLNTGQAQAA